MYAASRLLAFGDLVRKRINVGNYFLLREWVFFGDLQFWNFQFFLGFGDLEIRGTQNRSTTVAGSQTRTPRAQIRTGRRLNSYPPSPKLVRSSV